MSSNARWEFRIASSLSKNVIPSAVPPSRSKSPRKPFESGTETGPWSRTRLTSSSVRLASRPSKLATRAYMRYLLPLGKLEPTPVPGGNPVRAGTVLACAVRFGSERVPELWPRKRRGGEILLRVRRGARRFRSGGPCRAEGPHRPLRRPRWLHVALRAARSRGRAGRPGAVPRAAALRAGALGRNGGEVHRRCGDGAVRRAGDARGRSRACGPGRVGDPRLDRGGGRAAGADRGEHRRGARQSR